jgi:RNA polymerase sigma-70 factor (ECF subfamily)
MSPARKSSDSESRRDSPEGDFGLLERIAGGETTALEEFYDRYGGLVYAVCLRILRDGGDAEEVLQEVFFEVWRRGDRYDPSRGNPRVYLVHLARSRALDRLRRSRRREELGRRGLAVPEPDDLPAEPALDAAIASEERRRMRLALRGLPESQRKAVMLAFFDGLSHSEIARELDTPLGTVKTRIRKGLLRLREILLALLDEEGGR